MPYPPDKGERIRAFQELKALSKNFRITLATLAHIKEDYESAVAIRQLCERVIIAPAGGKKGLVRGISGITRGRSITEGYFYNRHFAKLLRKLSREEKYPVAVAYSSSMLPYLLEANAGSRVMDLVDVDSAKWFAYADEACWLKRWLYEREGRTVRRLEEDAIIQCDAVLVVSEAESKVLGGYANKLCALGNGVDIEYFTPEKACSDGKVSLVFTGTMNYRPNIEGVRWFVEEVWPKLKRLKPELTFYVVGRNPTRAVRLLGEQEGIEVTGTVSDVRPYLASASIAICPLRIARGIQNKVLEAMAMSRAVISTGPALEGLDVEAGKDVLQADTPEQWRTSILSLLEDESLREELGSNARKCVESRYNWDNRMAGLVELCDRLCEQQDQQVLTANQRKGALAQKPLVAARTAAKGDLQKLPASQPIEQKTKRRWFPSNWKEQLLWMFTLAYVVFLTVVTLTPVKEDGGGWLDVISPEMQNFLHVPAYSVLMILVTLAMVPTMRSRLVGIILSALCCCGFGILMEYAQGMVPGRVSHLTDMLRNCAGIMMVLPILFFWLWRPPSRYDK